MNDLNQDVDRFFRALEPKPSSNFTQIMKASFPVPPIIDYTPEKKVRRFVWSRLSRFGQALEERFARSERQKCFDFYICGDHYYTKKEWSWVESVGARSVAAMAKPIYDPNWKPPSPVKVEWGQRVIVGDYTGDDSGTVPA